MRKQQAKRVFDALKACQRDLTDALDYDSAKGSKFQKLEWLGDRVLKAELGFKVYYARGSISDEGQPSIFKPTLFESTEIPKEQGDSIASRAIWFSDSRRLSSGSR